MDAFKIAVKLFAATGNELTSRELVPVFHRWIQTHAVEDHMLIDVADYAHVVGGPGTVLVSSEANFYLDRGENRLGLLYSRKTPAPGGFAERLRAAIIEALKSAVRLEKEPSLAGRLKFDSDELLIRLNDRLHAPNSAQTFDDVKPDLEAIASDLYDGEAVTFEHHVSPQTLFEVRIKASESPSLATLLARLGNAVPVSSST